MAEKKSSSAGAASGKAKPPALTKMDAVRKGLAKLGSDARPVQLRDYVKTQFGIDMSADHASTCKGEILRRMAKAKQAPAKGPAVKPTVVKPAAAKAPAAKPAAARHMPAVSQGKPSAAKAPVTNRAAANGSAASGISLKDILTVKDLLGRVGASQLKTLIDAFTH